jgi:hypothetical protein
MSLNQSGSIEHVYNYILAVEGMKAKENPTLNLPKKRCDKKWGKIVLV